MHITGSHLKLILLLLVFGSPVFGQQTVDLSKVNAAYEGSFFKVNIGIAPGTFKDLLNDDSYQIAPLHFDIGGGKRLNKTFAPYINLHGNVLIKSTQYFSAFSEAGLGAGLNIYSKRANTYIAPEASFSVLAYEENGGNDFSRGNMGANLTVRSGWDFHIGGHVFAGAEAMLSYFFAKNSEDEYLKWNGFLYGANLYLKFGK